MRSFLCSFCIGVAAASGCGSDRDRGPSDGGGSDAGPRPDAGSVDAEPSDAGGTDAHLADSGVRDSGEPDGGAELDRWVPASTGHSWDRVISATASGDDLAVAFGPVGHVVWGGALWSSADLGGGVRTVLPFQDAFLVHYRPDGTYEWDRVLGVSREIEGVDLVRDLVVDASGNVYAVGSISDDYDFGGGTRTVDTQRDAFIVSYGSDGTYRWDRVYGSTERDTGLAVALTSAGDVCMAGVFQHTVDFGGGARTSPSGDWSSFVLCLGPDGTYRWDRLLGGTIRAMAIDASDRLVVGGTFRGSISIDGIPLVSAGEDDGVVVSIDSGGTTVWHRGLGTTGRDWVNDLAVDGSGNVVVTGLFGGQLGSTAATPLDFGGGARATAGTADVYVASYDAAGAHRWDRVVGGAGWDGSDGGIASDPAGYVVLAASLGAGSYDLGGGTRTAPLALAAYAPDGSYLWDTSPVGAEGWAHEVALHGSGHIAVVGRFRGTMDFGGGARTEPYDSTIPPFLWVLEPR